MIYLFKKDDIGEFCKHLTLNEVACKCEYAECRSVYLTVRTVEAFSRLRAAAEGPLRVTSGQRCARHNMDVHGEPLSRHVTGQALDIKCPAHLDINVFAVMAKNAGFSFVKIYKSWIHVDTR